MTMAGSTEASLDQAIGSAHLTCFARCRFPASMSLHPNNFTTLHLLRTPYTMLLNCHYCRTIMRADAISNILSLWWSDEAVYLVNFSSGASPHDKTGSTHVD
jgi:hypothetical protein